MKRSELEKDVAFILDAFKEVDYEIPSNRNILKVIFSKLVIVYALQVSFIIVDVFFNSKSGEYHYFDTIVLALGSNAFFSVVFLMSTYDSVCMRLALGDEIINQSVFFKLIEKKIGFYSLFLMSVNTVVGFILILKDESLIGGLGFSWFVTYIISMLTLQTSLSRYMTPAVVSSLSKMKELISASPK
ncbi:TPA: protein traS [Escherichia coli]|nr:protein traS [Escherichia coli]ELS1685306.1 protein traS [Escherichia coli]HDT0730742.1 protein traS [Escherichia coli]